MWIRVFIIPTVDFDELEGIVALYKGSCCEIPVGLGFCWKWFRKWKRKMGAYLYRYLPLDFEEVVWLDVGLFRGKIL